MAFIVVLKEKDREALAAIRLYPNIEVASDAAQIWLRLSQQKDVLDAPIRQLPLLATFILGDNEQLYPVGGLTPVSQLKPMNWMSLTDFLPVELPVSVMPAVVSDAVSVRVVPSENEQNAVALGTDRATWLAYISTAAEARLKRLRFAVSDDNMVLIVGEPLPPIEGETYWLRHNIFMPVGFDFEFPIVSELLFQKEKLDNQDFLLFNTEGAFYRIEALDFVLATRSAVRLTFQ
jgi:MoxR-vWA-beta-propeller ternary system domain bpX2